MRYYLILTVAIFCLHSINTSTHTLAVNHNSSSTSVLVSTDNNAKSPYELIVNIDGISIIEVDILNIGGGRSTTVMNTTTVDSDQKISINPTELGLTSGDYILQVRVNDEVSTHEFSVE